MVTLLQHLYDLLQLAKTWSCRKSQEEAFSKSKELLLSATILTHYDPEKPLVFSCDTSPYGVGAVLSHCMEDRSEQPIAYASRTLSTTEIMYAQLDKEALSIVFGVKLFHQFLCGHKFTIFSDFKPLRYIPAGRDPWGANHGFCSHSTLGIDVKCLAITTIYATSRIYEISYKPGADHTFSDDLSRLLVSKPVKTVPLPGDMLLLFQTLQDTLVRADQIRQWTDTDTILSRVRRNVLSGWID